MGKAAAARKLAAAAAFGGGGLTAAGGGLYGLLRLEAAMARKRIGNATGTPPDATGWYGRGLPGPALKVALLGDSSAAGYGVDRVQETPGAALGTGLAERTGRRIYFRSFAVVGARSSDLAGQVEAALPVEPDVAVILIGANDVTHRVPPKTSVRLLSEAVTRLRSHNVTVVVGTCPDLGTIRPIPQPLKQVARSWSRRLAAAQAIAVVEAGGRTVSMSSILGAEFDAAPAIFFGPDQFHPSAEGYASMAAVLLPSVLAALELIPEEHATPEALRGEGVLPIARAAVRAAKTPGTELGSAEVAGSSRGVRGRWVALRHRRQGPRAKPQAPDESEAAENAEAVDADDAAAGTSAAVD